MPSAVYWASSVCTMCRQHRGMCVAMRQTCFGHAYMGCCVYLRSESESASYAGCATGVQVVGGFAGRQPRSCNFWLWRITAAGSGPVMKMLLCSNKEPHMQLLKGASCFTLRSTAALLVRVRGKQYSQHASLTNKTAMCPAKTAASSPSNPSCKLLLQCLLCNTLQVLRGLLLVQPQQRLGTNTGQLQGSSSAGGILLQTCIWQHHACERA